MRDGQPSWWRNSESCLPDAACAAWDADIERASADGTWDSDSRSPPLTASAAAYNVAIPLGWWGAAPAFVAPA